MADSREKEIILIGEKGNLWFDSIKKATVYLGCSKVVLNNRIKNGKPINGFCADYLFKKDNEE